MELPRDYRNRYPHELSGGQKQRVGIARALSLKPKLMVADEPTSALDVSVQAKVLELFQNLQKELGFACLFVTHDLAVVDVLADRICVMQRGRIVEQGTRDQILRNPQEPYTQRLLAAVPLPDPEKQRERQGTARPAALGRELGGPRGRVSVNGTVTRRRAGGVCYQRVVCDLKYVSIDASRHEVVESRFGNGVPPFGLLAVRLLAYVGHVTGISLCPGLPGSTSLSRTNSHNS